jgi:hypothetical protein
MKNHRFAIAPNGRTRAADHESLDEAIGNLRTRDRTSMHLRLNICADVHPKQLFVDSRL